MANFTPPTNFYGWPTGNRFIDRIQIDRGITVISNGMGGWTQTEFPYIGNIGNVNPITSVQNDLVEGIDYFLGGHYYPNIPSDVATSLEAAGYILS